jgi:hypothetical protein
MKKCGLFSLVLAIFLSGAAAFLAGCSSDGTATVTIRLGLNDHALLPEKSVIDRALVFLTLARNVSAAPPANITGIDIFISAPDISIRKYSFSPGITEATVEAPAGNNRTFTAVANIDPADPRAVLAYGGSATVDLSPGDDVTVTIRMVTRETKLLIADGNNNRVIQVNDMSGAGWDYYSISTPSDIAFDAKGRIYIASSTDLTRIDNISGAGTAFVVAGQPPRFVAVDLNNDLVYSAINTNLYRHEVSDPNPTPPVFPVTIPNVLSIHGLAVHSDGTLFIACLYDPDLTGPQPQRPVILHYRYDTQAVLGTTYGDPTLLYNITHILLKEPYIYVLHTNAFNVTQIAQFDTGLNFIRVTGSWATDLNTHITPPMTFFFPIRFVAVLNRKITLLDDDYAGAYNHDRVIQFSTLDGGDWSIYGDYGSGAHEFNFYS